VENEQEKSNQHDCTRNHIKDPTAMCFRGEIKVT